MAGQILHSELDNHSIQEFTAFLGISTSEKTTYSSKRCFSVLIVFSSQLTSVGLSSGPGQIPRGDVASVHKQQAPGKRQDSCYPSP